MLQVKQKHQTETIGRSFLKAVTFRLVVLLSDSVIIYVLTRRIDITLGVMVFSNLSSTFLYFMHERAWNSIVWGKRIRTHK